MQFCSLNSLDRTGGFSGERTCQPLSAPGLRTESPRSITGVGDPEGETSSLPWVIFHMPQKQFRGNLDLGRPGLSWKFLGLSLP